MEVGVVGKGCANVPFKGAVTMNLVPRGFWRKVLNENEKAFLVQFNPERHGDLSAIVAKLRGVDSTQDGGHGDTTRGEFINKDPADPSPLTGAGEQK
ncbi:predicted protein [Chaetomium globosum CBS 148.51]|uniref:Uncharacterized protein n=1 Tax=Chaetomium globosum (strain ATCC 6205 / CBS 148.51 / DSM 1962 / NBRC 6347 / NRRL 1970) TaxID=306901 RepID=Q2GRP4_CHAGB|nr:uncharacterized protein CHGG_09360 [Chaetomium globosum CBS 148.51]EAQ85346.1 predicted protein [Chaetomium globosum CBS 148.51]